VVSLKKKGGACFFFSKKQKTVLTLFGTGEENKKTQPGDFLAQRRETR